MFNLSRKLLFVLVGGLCVVSALFAILWINERTSRAQFESRRTKEMTYVKRFSQGEYSIKPSPHVQFFQDGLPVGAIDFRYIGPAFDAEGGSILDRYYYRCGIFQLAVAERNQLQREDPKIDVAREVTESIVDQLQRQEPAFALKTIVSISPSVCAGQLSHPAGVVSIVCSKLENQREQYAIVVSFSAFSSLAPEMIVDIKKNGTMVTKPTTAVFP